VSRPDLASLLAAASPAAGEAPAFASVFSRWGVEVRRSGNESVCDAGRSAGLECLARVGNWTRLRRFDLPAVLDLSTAVGDRRRVALVGLTGQEAWLEIEGRTYAFPLGEIDRVWDGSFTLVWRTPPFGSRVISRGMRGKDVEWLRKKLDALQGRPSDRTASDVYDPELERRLVAFQRSRSLNPDGIVGSETLALLALAEREAGTPSLSQKAP
jgi:general secretion pathway protein A